jgi:diguanylate cyclase (GGDEF)-like protein/PAS domain S-box-containing protein
MERTSTLDGEGIRLLLDSTAEGIYSIDLEGCCTFANRSCHVMLGYPSADDLLGRNMHALIHHSWPDGTPMPDGECKVYKAFRGGSGSHVDDEVLWRADGTAFPVEYWAYPHVENGAVTGAVVTFLDISERKKTQEALHASEERYRLLAHYASDVIWTMDLEGHLTFISPSIEKLRGFTVEEALRQSLHESLTPESKLLMDEVLALAKDSVRKGHKFPEHRGEFEQPCKDGSMVWAEITTAGMYNEKDEFIGILGVSRDVTERRSIQERIDYLAHHDALTGLPNRILFSDRLERAIALARREKRTLALLFIDLDRFKPINDKYGHALGDLLLKEVARRMQACLRTSDTIGRIGGDEFVVTLPGAIEEQGARVVGEKIRKALEVPFTIDGKELSISATVGITLYPRHGVDAIQLTGNADVAMYNAKRSGGNTVRVYEPGMQ